MPQPDGPLRDSELQVGACGDWLVGVRLEGAWLSGRNMANTLLDKLFIGLPRAPR